MKRVVGVGCIVLRDHPAEPPLARAAVLLVTVLLGTGWIGCDLLDPCANTPVSEVVSPDGRLVA